MLLVGTSVFDGYQKFEVDAEIAKIPYSLATQLYDLCGFNGIKSKVGNKFMCLLLASSPWNAGLAVKNYSGIANYVEGSYGRLYNLYQQMAVDYFAPLGSQIVYKYHPYENIEDLSVTFPDAIPVDRKVGMHLFNRYVMEQELSFVKTISFGSTATKKTYTDDIIDLYHLIFSVHLLNGFFASLNIINDVFHQANVVYILDENVKPSPQSRCFAVMAKELFGIKAEIIKEVSANLKKAIIIIITCDTAECILRSNDKENSVILFEDSISVKLNNDKVKYYCLQGTITKSCDENALLPSSPERFSVYTLDVTVRDILSKYILEKELKYSKSKYRVSFKEEDSNTLRALKNSQYDACVVGLSGYQNYGASLTILALVKVLQQLGQSVVLSKDPKRGRFHLRAQEHIDILKSLGVEWCNLNSKSATYLSELNLLADKFVLASDQVWSNDYALPGGEYLDLGFVDNDKVKIACGVSAGGKTKFLNYKDTSRQAKFINNIKRIDYIGTREDWLVEQLKQVSVSAVHTGDPVFWIERSFWDNMSQKSDAILPESDYIFSYMLRPPHYGNSGVGTTKVDIIKTVSTVLGYAPLTISGRYYENDKRQSELDAIMPYINEKQIGFVSEYNLYDFVNAVKRCRFMLTDSFHGTCFAIIYNKPFVVLPNMNSTSDRLYSLLDFFELSDCYYKDPQDLLDGKLKTDFDWDSINNKLADVRGFSISWLKNALATKKAIVTTSNERPVIQKDEATFDLSKIPADLKRCRLVVSCVKAYGIHHVVLCPGGKDIDLVRLFERSGDFVTHSVVDERSAGYFAIGLAIKLKETVAVCCTSGTAVSNLLPAVTEAYHQRVSLVVISADRYPQYLGQSEEQTISQHNIFGVNVKKVVNLSIDTSTLTWWESRRNICDALLESTHHGCGPVHINVPIASVYKGELHESIFNLDNVKIIRKVTPGMSSSIWEDMNRQLTKANRILIVVGQAVPDKEFDDLLSEFARKYNAVIVGDPISNCAANNILYPYNLLKGMKSEEFAKNLSPDTIITFGEKLLFQDPIKEQLKSGHFSANHWRIAADGLIADPFRKLSVVFECSGKYFLKHFIQSNSNDLNDTFYREQWENSLAIVRHPTTEAYSQRYAIHSVIRNMPQNSLMHIGIGSTMCIVRELPLNAHVTAYCNMGTNGIDGSASSFMGQAMVSSELCFLLISDLSFFYDMNSIWRRELKPNIRILLTNNYGTSFLGNFQSPAIAAKHDVSAKGWVEAVGFNYLSSVNKNEFDEALPLFITQKSDRAIFFEVLL
ncbi:hypothetical protein FACS18949_11200 [Clostridia bacterium]|nr:hypothetical protein FACS18949_11200 [Clostridia bacterium]